MRLLLFDFDGVISDSFVPLFEAVKAACREIGLDLDEQQYRDLFLKNVKQAEKDMVKDEKKFQKLQELIREKVRSAYRRVKLFEFAPALIKALGEQHLLAIISSTAPEVIMKKLGEYNLGKYFRSILGPERALSKQDKFKKILQEFSIPNHHVFFISDTVGDLLEGNQFGLKTIAVTWGFHDRSTLAQARPDFLIDTPHELLEIV